MLLTALAAQPAPSRAQDKVSVGVFPLSSSLPYFVALERGFFKEQNIEPEMTKLMGGPAERRGADHQPDRGLGGAGHARGIERQRQEARRRHVHQRSTARPRSGRWSSSSSATAFQANSIADLKGAKLMSAPGPANLNTAKAILARNGLKEGDYTIDQLDMGQHVNAMTAGTFDGGYTLEPNASMMIKAGVARSLEAGRDLEIYPGQTRAPTPMRPAAR